MVFMMSFFKHYCCSDSGVGKHTSGSKQLKTEINQGGDRFISTQHYNMVNNYVQRYFH